ncbi:MAG: alpha/beta hydrolase [Rhodocyclaceae bacterium]|nr:alpha/beta hydrolase [Rhodocyclaceae bacterium]
MPVSSGFLAFHRTGGRGTPLVLSHGLTDNGLCWSRLAIALESDFDIIMLDSRGHGNSSRISSAASNDPGQDIADAINQLNLHSPIVMGHSVGARATAEFANVYPHLVSKVILEDPPFVPVVDPLAADLRRQKFHAQVTLFHSMSDADITAMGRATALGWHDDEFAAWTAGKRQVDANAMPDYRTPWQDSIARIATPTLLIYGEQERGGIVTPAIAAQARQINPNITAAQISGAGHNIRRENFSAYLAAIRDFLTSS